MSSPGGATRRRRGEPVDRRKTRFFLAGIAVLWLGADWPIHDLAERYLYHVHMEQHMLFTLVAPALLIAGMPPWLLRRLPATRSPSRTAFGFLTKPIVALILFNSVLLFVHWPAVVALSVSSEWAHFGLHLLLVSTALVMWWPVMSPLPEYPALPAPGQMLYLFLQSLAPTIPASFLTFGDHLLYPVYGTFPRIWGISALSDQLLAGLIMKLVGGAILWVFITAIFFRWYREEHRGEGWDASRYRDVEHDDPRGADPMTDQMTNEKPAAAPEPDAHPETRQGLLLPILIPLGSFAIIGVVLFGFSRVLLSITPHAATAVALIVAVSVMVVAIVVASRQRLSNGSLFSMVGSIAGIAMLAGGLAIVTIGAGEEEGGGGPQVVTLAAPKGAAATGFDPTSLSVVANAPIELDFTNQDPGIQHNVVIFGEDPADNPDAKEVFSGALVTGAAEVKYDVPPLTPGTFFFHCAVHPTTMFGTIDSAEGGGERRWRRWWRRNHRGGQGSGLRHGSDRSHGRTADDPDVRQRGCRYPAQHRDLQRRLPVRGPVPGHAVPRDRHRGVSDPDARRGDVLLPLRRPPHDERLGGGRSGRGIGSRRRTTAGRHRRVRPVRLSLRQHPC